MATELSTKNKIIKKAESNVEYRDLLKADNFFVKLAELKDKYKNKEIDKEKYLDEKVELYRERALQRGARMFLIAEKLLAQHPDDSVENLKSKVIKYFQEKSLPLSNEQLFILDKVGNALENRRKAMDNLLQGLREFDSTFQYDNLQEAESEINKSLRRQIFVLSHLDNIPNEILSSINQLVLTIFEKEEKEVDLQYKRFKQESEEGGTEFLANNYEEIGKWASIAEEMSNVKGKIMNLVLNSVKVSKDKEALLTVVAEIDELLKNFDEKLSLNKDVLLISLTAKPLAVAVFTGDINLWDQKGGAGYFAYDGLGIFINKQDGNNVRYDEEEVNNTTEHEYQHFLYYYFQEKLANDIKYHVTMKNIKKYRRGGLDEKDSGLTDSVIWSRAQTELISYLERDDMLPNNLKPLLGENIINKEKSVSETKEVNQIKILHDRIRILILLGVNLDSVVGVIRASDKVITAINRLDKNFDFSKNILNKNIPKQNIQLLSPYDTILFLKQNKLLSVFLGSLASVEWFVDIVGIESNDEDAFMTFIVLLEEFKDSEEEMQLIIKKKMVTSGYAAMSDIPEKLKNNIMMNSMNGLDIDNNQEGIEKELFKYIKTIIELVKILDIKLATFSLDIKYVKMWNNFSEEEKVTAQELLKQKRISKEITYVNQNDWLTMCVDAVFLASLNNDKKNKIELLNKAESKFFLAGVRNLLEALSIQNRIIQQQMSDNYTYLRTQLEGVGHFEASEFIESNLSILEKISLIDIVNKEGGFDSLFSLKRYFALKFSSISYFKDIAWYDNQAETIRGMYTSLKGRKIGKYNPTNEELLGLLFDLRKIIGEYFKNNGNVEALLKNLLHVEYNSETGGEIGNMESVKNWISTLLA